MIKRMLRLNCMVIIVIFIFSYFCGVTLADEDGKMAHNIYSDPDLSKTSGKIDTFAIDFKATQVPRYTYWSLCNWFLDLTDFKESNGYAYVDGGGAYSGFMYGEEKSAILSFWEIRYSEDGDADNPKILNAQCIYPNEGEPFSGEGEGMHNIVDFDWKDNNWYRMIIHCWKDKETGNTFVGQWAQDLETGKWTICSYFNTNLKNTYLKGNLSQFQENFVATTAEEVREFYFKNMYAKNHNQDGWISLDTTTMTYNTPDFGYTSRGRHEFGATSEHFYGLAGGNVEDKEKYDEEMPTREILTIQQPDTPDFGPIKIKSLEMDIENNTIEWEYDEDSAPQEAVIIEVKDTKNNKIVDREEITRPEVRSYECKQKLEESYGIQLTTRDIFGNEKIKKLGLLDDQQEDSDQNKPGDSKDSNDSEDKDPSAGDEDRNEGTAQRQNGILDENKDDSRAKNSMPNTGEKKWISLIIVFILATLLSRLHMKSRNK